MLIALLGAFVALASQSLVAPASVASSCEGSHWVAAWSASPADPAVGQPFSGQTLRMKVTPSIGGEQSRVRLSNRYGQAPLIIDRVSIGRPVAGGREDPSPGHAIDFSGESSVTIPPGDDAVSDPVDFPLVASRPLTVSIAISPESRADLTRHTVARQTSWVQPTVGDPVPTNGRLTLTGVEALADARVGATVAFGDSFTDGFQAVSGKGFDEPIPAAESIRYPDLLAQRLDRATGAPELSVVNAGISGNRLLSDSLLPLYGPAGLSRLDADVIEQPGATDVIVLIGINDLRSVAAEKLIAGLARAVARLRRAGLNTLLGTIPPGSWRAGGEQPTERYRLITNRWIRSQRLADAVVDFDAALRDPARPRELRPRFDSGDGVHPNEAGYRRMARAVPLGALEGTHCPR